MIRFFPEKFLFISVAIFFLFISSSSIRGNEWLLQNPSIVANGFMDVNFPTATTGFIVGAGGTVLRTENGGSHWDINNTDENWWLRSVDFIDEKNGWIAGGANSLYLLNTTDGGLTWKTVEESIMPPGMMNLYVNCVEFTSINHGFIGGRKSSSSLFRTTNGGTEWEECSCNVNEIYDICFLNQTTGFACGDGCIARSVDSGKTWQPCSITDTLTTIPLEQRFFIKILFLTEETGYCLAHQGAIFKTENGGESWYPVLDIGITQLQTMSFLNINEGFTLFGWNPVVALVTHDAGETWEEHASGIYVNTSACQVVNEAGGIIVTFNGAIYRFDGLLDTVYEITQGTGGGIRSIDFSDKHCGFAVGYDSTFLQTENGGLLWKKGYLPTGNVEKILSFNEKKTLVIDQEGTIYQSTDNGTTWNKNEYSNGRYFNSLPTQAGKINGCDGCAYILGRENHVHLSFDGGDTWEKRGILVNGDIEYKIQTVHFLDTIHIWASDLYGTLFYSDNQGQQWQLLCATLSADKSFKITALFFVDTLNGWLGGYSSGSYDSFVMKTEDGGKTWQHQSNIVFIERGSILSDRAIVEIYAQDKNRAWAVYRGGVLSTIDGGDTWVENRVENLGHGLSDGVFVPPDDFWITGWNNGIWKYSSSSSINEKGHSRHTKEKISFVMVNGKRITIPTDNYSIDKVEMFNCLGRKMFHKTYGNNRSVKNISIPRNGLSKGIYYILITNSRQGSTISIPFISY